MAKKILLIEDDSYFAQLCQHGLEKYGFLVIRAADGEEGLGKLKEQKPDLVILDILMPRMNGLDVLRKIRQEEESAGSGQMPVIMLTNMYQKEDVETSMLLKANAYLVKAMTDINQLVLEIEKVFKK